MSIPLDPPIIEDVSLFIERIENLPPAPRRDTRDIMAALRPSLDAEFHLREVFAKNRSDPRLSDKYVGLFDVFSIPEALRTTKSRNAQEIRKNLNSQHIFPLDDQKRRKEGDPSMVADLAQFELNFSVFTSGTFRFVKWDHIVVAGGSVLACITPPWNLNGLSLAKYYHDKMYRSSDVDIFLYDLSPEEAELKMNEIFEAVKMAVPFDVACIRKRHTISIISQYPYRTIQIVLRLYHSPAEILAGFDVDSACVLFDGRSVFANPRAFVSITAQVNTVDLSRRSPSYESRLFKYSSRGFEVYMPNLKRANILPQLYSPNLRRFPKGLARLLVLEAMSLGHVSYKFLAQPHKSNLSASDKRNSFTEMGNLDLFGATSSYDTDYIFIPYGPMWDSGKIRDMYTKIIKNLNFMESFDEDGNWDDEYETHHHFIFIGTMAECFQDLCPNCPGSTVSTGGSTIQGRVIFMTDNPGQQILTGSFNPTNEITWEEYAYLGNIDLGESPVTSACVNSDALPSPAGPSDESAEYEICSPQLTDSSLSESNDATIRTSDNLEQVSRILLSMSMDSAGSLAAELGKYKDLIANQRIATETFEFERCMLHKNFVEKRISERGYRHAIENLELRQRDSHQSWTNLSAEMEGSIKEMLIIASRFTMANE